MECILEYKTWRCIVSSSYGNIYRSATIDVLVINTLENYFCAINLKLPLLINTKNWLNTLIDDAKNILHIKHWVLYFNTKM